jgi:type I restriction enzyme M protein
MCTVEARTRNAFHLDNFRLAADGRIKLPHRATGNDDRAAREGDILIARVGRKISEKVVLVTSGSTPISDCIYRLRCPPRVVHRVWIGLRSDEGRRQVEDSLSGVTTRLLPLAALMGVHV